MSIAVSIISTIIKSAIKSKVGNELSNELIGISVDDVSEKGISKINDFINNGRTKIEKILSKEKMKSMGISEDNIAYVIAEVKGLLSEIEITDDIFRQCKYDSLNLCSFMWKKYSENKTDYIECEGDIKKSLLAVSEALIKLMCESEEFVKDISIQISNTVEDSRVEIQRISDYLEENFSKISADNQRIFDILRKILEQNQKSKMQKKSRTQEYAAKWNANMFLNDFDKRDENAGVNVKLSDVYIDDHLPHYIWGNNGSKSNDLKDLLTEYIKEHNDNKMLLVLGQPGIGKSTLITWITASFSERRDDILVYQFASDLKCIEWKKNSITESILDSLGYLYDDLNRKILILDGLDEWGVQIDKKDILDSLYEDLIYKENINDFTLIVTCRVNYIQELYNVKFKYIALCSWDESQIKSFCSIFERRTKVCVLKDTIDNLINNKNILGVPLVLYMVLALNISFEKNGSIVDVYDRIFSLEGGIYDRCIDNKRFADKHRIAEVKKQIHQISREIAMWMFENNPDEAYIPQKEYKKICTKIMQASGEKENDIEQDFIIGNFFELKHCEGEKGEELYFVHRSIYEYFVVETIYSSIENSIRVLSEESQEELAANIAVYLKQGKITNNIGEYFQYKIMKIFSQLSLENKNIFFDWWESSVGKMLTNGMFYYTNKNINYYRNIISEECQCFGNILKILKLLLDMSKRKYVLENVERGILDKYIKYYLLENGLFKRTNNSGEMSEKEMEELISNNETSIDGKLSQREIEIMLGDVNQDLDLSQISLCRIDFRETDLKRINLTGSNLTESNLAGVDLKCKYLNNIVLKGANLKKADLRGANLQEINLRGADLREADLRSASLREVDLREADLYNASMVNVSLNRVKLSRTNLSKANLIHSNWSNCDLNNSNFNKSNLSKINLQKASLYRANFLWADLRGIDFRGADLRGADLRLADLREADLHEVDLKESNLMFAKFDEEQITYLTNCDLSKSLVYVEEYDRFVDYLKYQKIKNDNKSREILQ